MSTPTDLDLTTGPARPRLGDDLERRRLELRRRRIELVLMALRDRATLRVDVGGTVPAPLHQSIVSFAAELGHVRRRLSELSAPPER